MSPARRARLARLETRLAYVETRLGRFEVDLDRVGAQLGAALHLHPPALAHPGGPAPCPLSPSTASVAS